MYVLTNTCMPAPPSVPVQVGDEVLFRPSSGHTVEGIVVDVGWYRTTIRSFEREIYMIPNSGGCAGWLSAWCLCSQSECAARVAGWVCWAARLLGWRSRCRAPAKVAPLPLAHLCTSLT
jgi:hypothetical protein